MNLVGGLEWDTIQPITNPKDFSLLNEFKIIELTGITQPVILSPQSLALKLEVIVISVSYQII